MAPSFRGSSKGVSRYTRKTSIISVIHQKRILSTGTLFVENDMAIILALYRSDFGTLINAEQVVFEVDSYLG